jgi:hypothetical protein
MAPTSWIFVAFVTAIVVMVIAATSSESSRRGVRQFVADVGWKARHEPAGAWVDRNAGTGPRAATMATPTTDRPADEEGGVAELFGVGEVPDSAYVDPTPLTEPIARITRSLRSLVRS